MPRCVQPFCLASPPPRHSPSCCYRRTQEELLLTAIDSIDSNQALAIPVNLLPLLTRASNDTVATLSSALDDTELANSTNASDVYDLRVWLPRK